MANAATPLSERPNNRGPVRARLAVSLSQFANARGFYLGRRSTKVHVALYRWSGGRLASHLPGMPGARILLLDHVGAKSGIRRTSPLMYHREGEVIAVAASKAGQPTNPAWFHNLQANPDTTIQIAAEVRDVRARVASDAERRELWPRFVSFYPGYEFYERLAGDRRIPIVILEPRRSARGAEPASCRRPSGWMSLPPLGDVDVFPAEDPQVPPS